MGLKDLSKGIRSNTEVRAKEMINPEAFSEQADSFISKAKERQDYSSLEKEASRKKKYVRCIFSLTEDISKQIDTFSYLPKTFRAGRSDVVKAALMAFSKLPENEIIEHLQMVNKS
jgi:hypothetical protein